MSFTVPRGQSRSLIRAADSPMEPRMPPPPACEGQPPAPPAPSGRARGGSAGCWCPAPQTSGSDLQAGYAVNSAGAAIQAWYQTCIACANVEFVGGAACRCRLGTTSQKCPGQLRQGGLTQSAAARDSTAEVCRGGPELMRTQAGCAVWELSKQGRAALALGSWQ